MKTRTWIMLIGTLLVLSIIAIILMQTDNNGADAVAKIYLENECIHTIALSDAAEPYSISVTGKNGTNIISVEYGRICVSEADCPDQVCVNQGWLSSGITPIVCLPNRLVIKLEQNDMASDEAEPDGVVR